VEGNVTVRVLFVFAALVVLYGCGQASSPPKHAEKNKSAERPKTAVPSGTKQEQTNQASGSPGPEAVIGESLEAGSFDLRVLDYFVTDSYYYLTDPKLDEVQESLSQAGKFVVVNYSLTNTSSQTVSPTPFAQLHAANGEVFDQTPEVSPPHRIDPVLAVDDIPPRGMIVSQFIFDVPSDVVPELLTITNEPTLTRSLDVGAVDLTSENPQGPSPEEILALQYEYANMTAWKQAYELFAQESQARVSEQEYADFWKSRPPEAITEYSFPSVVVQGDHATIERVYTDATAKKSVQSKATQEAVREDDGWRIVMRDSQVKAFISEGAHSASASSESTSRSASASASAP
jgi:hypothetical protein